MAAKTRTAEEIQAEIDKLEKAITEGRKKTKSLKLKKAAMDRATKRKAETRRKIELGGLIIKAGFGDMDKAAILGMLQTQAVYLKENPAIVNRWRNVGAEIFAQDQAANKGE